MISSSRSAVEQVAVNNLNSVAGQDAVDQIEIVTAFVRSGRRALRRRGLKMHILSERLAQARVDQAAALALAEHLLENALNLRFKHHARLIAVKADKFALSEKCPRFCIGLAERHEVTRAQAEEARVYEEKIHHLADQMIKIDLDDGVKVNYAKFQDVLAPIK